MNQEWIEWGFGNDTVKIKAHSLGKDREFYVSVKSMGDRPLGGFVLVIRKKGSGRKALTFRYPTFNLGLNAILKYVRRH